MERERSGLHRLLEINSQKPDHVLIEIRRTNSQHPDFITLVKELDAELSFRDGNEHSFYSKFNKIDQIGYAVVIYENDKPLGCGAIKKFDTKTMEVKRMYVVPSHRGKGVATSILNELEKWAAEMAFEKSVLETGKKQPEAIRLYEKSGYYRIPNYGQYAGVENSVCYAKRIRNDVFPA